MHPARRLCAILACIVAVSGCQGGQGPGPADRDGDGLWDDVEEQGWSITLRRHARTCFSSAPPPEETRQVTGDRTRIDADGDGASDLIEFEQRSDPHDVDTDDDGLHDGDEVLLRANDTFHQPSRILLYDADSDGDCLLDGDEVGGIVIPRLGARTSDPTDFNSDGDGFSDADEVYRTHSDPSTKDTDGDGAEDHFDVDPRRDVWVRFDLGRLLLKEAPSGSGSRADVVLDWAIPTTPPTTRPSPRPWFNVPIRVDSNVPSNNSPGLLNLDDRHVAPYAELQVQGFQVNATGTLVAVIDLNPFVAHQPVTWRLNVSSGAWSFRDGAGNWTLEGNQASIESSRARLTFALAVVDAPAR